MPEKLSEAEFLERLANQETRDEAFRQFFKVYSTRLYVNIRRLVANHEDANDILQETFMKAYQASAVNRRFLHGFSVLQLTRRSPL